MALNLPTKHVLLHPCVYVFACVNVNVSVHTHLCVIVSALNRDGSECDLLTALPYYADYVFMLRVLHLLSIDRQ